MRNSLLDEDHEQFMRKEGWRRIQDEDRILKYRINNIKDETCPDTNYLPEQDRHEHINIRKSFNKLTLEENILYRKIIFNDKPVKQLVIPPSVIPEVLNSLHNNLGHLGRDRYMSLVRDRFYWPSMTADVEKRIQKSERCVKRNATKAPLQCIQTTQPLELVCMDFLTLEMSKVGY